MAGRHTRARDGMKRRRVYASELNRGSDLKWKLDSFICMSSKIAWFESFQSVYYLGGEKDSGKRAWGVTARDVRWIDDQWDPDWRKHAGV